jgi:glutathione S-transferase
MYTLIGSTTSPYVRKLRLLFAKHDINYEFKTINYLEENDSNYLKKINPINKIPLLLHGTETIFDSRVIYNYLAKKHHFTELTIAEENILSSIDAAMDTSINLFSLRRGGLDLTSDNAYLKRQLERVPLILDSLIPWIKSLNPNNTKDWNYLSMSLYAYLYWGDFRQILDLTNYPDAKKFLNDFKTMPNIKETDIVA